MMGRAFFRSIVGHPGAAAGSAILLLVVLIALFAPLLSPHDPYAQTLSARLIPPFWMEGNVAGHWLGTDALGRDYLARLLYGARIVLLIGLGVAALSALIGTTLGVLAGYFGGRVDMAVSFLVSTRLAMPVVLVALAVVAIAGGSVTTVVLTLGLLLWDRFAVVGRAATRQVCHAEYITAARAMGASHLRVILGDVLPNIAGPLIVVATLEVAHAVMLEAALSFLGLGVQPPLPSWGLMIAEGRKYLLFDAWLIVLPGAALFALVLGINLLGDGLRDLNAPAGRH